MAPSKNLVNETIEVDASDDSVTLAEYPGLDTGDVNLRVGPMGRESENIALWISPSALNQQVGLSLHVIVDHGDDKLEVDGLLNIDSREDAERIAAALLAAFPPADDAE